MPHTSHRKKTSRAKRMEVTTEDGWTRVTTTNPSQRVPRPLPLQKALDERNETISAADSHLKMADNTTIHTVTEQYVKYRTKWLDSESHRDLEKFLTNELDLQILRDIDQCLLFGSGSFTGLRDGWIDRSNVSLVQLAAFVSVLDIIEKTCGVRPRAFAQEPLYTPLDVEFLSNLGIEPAYNLAGFSRITTKSLTFALGAEIGVELSILDRDPAVDIQTGPLDLFWRNLSGEISTNCTSFEVFEANQNADSSDGPSEAKKKYGTIPGLETYVELHETALQEQRRSEVETKNNLKDKLERGMQICEDFKKGKGVRRIVALTARDEPFHDVHVYYRQVQDQ